MKASQLEYAHSEHMEELWPLLYPPTFNPPRLRSRFPFPVTATVGQEVNVDHSPFQKNFPFPESVRQHGMGHAQEQSARGERMYTRVTFRAALSSTATLRKTNNNTVAVIEV